LLSIGDYLDFSGFDQFYHGWLHIRAIQLAPSNRRGQPRPSISRYI